MIDFQHLDPRVDGEHIVGGQTLGGDAEARLELDVIAPATALRRHLVTEVIDQDFSHGLRRRAEEMPSPVPSRIGLTDELHVGLVHQRGRLQRLPRPLARELRGGERTELGVDDGQELGGCAAIASAEIAEEQGHFAVHVAFSLTSEEVPRLFRGEAILFECSSGQ